MKTLTKKDIKKLHVKKSGSGFTIWVTEKKKDGGHTTHWILDASTFKSTGEISLGNLYNNYGIELKYDSRRRVLTVQDRKRGKKNTEIAKIYTWP
jgi:hypothetical protein